MIRPNKMEMPFPATPRNLILLQQCQGRIVSAFEEVDILITTYFPSIVIYKLLGFTLCMITGPIGTYFLTLNTIFRGWLSKISSKQTTYSRDTGSSTWAGATAAFVANMVLIAYVIIAMKEDQSEKLAAEQEARKGQ